MRSLWSTEGRHHCWKIQLNVFWEDWILRFQRVVPEHPRCSKVGFHIRHMLRTSTWKEPNFVIPKYMYVSSHDWLTSLHQIFEAHFIDREEANSSTVFWAHVWYSSSVGDGKLCNTWSIELHKLANNTNLTQVLHKLMKKLTPAITTWLSASLMCDNNESKLQGSLIHAQCIWTRQSSTEWGWFLSWHTTVSAASVIYPMVPYHACTKLHLCDSQDNICGSSERSDCACEFVAHHLGQYHTDGLAQHHSLCLNPTHTCAQYQHQYQFTSRHNLNFGGGRGRNQLTPSNDAQPIDHSGMAVSTNNTVRIEKAICVEDHTTKIL